MRKSLDNWTLLAVICLHVAVALPAAYYLNIWVDEASSLYATEHGLLNAIRNAAVEQKQAPLYFWILSLWREIDGSIFFARLFSIICSVISIKLFAGLVSRVANSPGTALLIAFFGLHPFLIWASVEIRVYSLVILLSIVLLRLFFTAFWKDPEDRPERSVKVTQLWFLVAVVIALYTNYYLGFLIAGFFAALVYSGRWREARRFALLMTAAAVTFLPLLFDMFSELLAKSTGFSEPRTLTEGVRLIWHHFLSFVFPTELLPTGEQTTISYLRLWIMRFSVPIAVVIIIWKRGQLLTLTRSLAVIAMVVALFLIAAYFLIGGLYVHIRHASVLFVPLILLLASLGADLLRDIPLGRARVLTLTGAVLMLALFSYSTLNLYPEFTKRGDWQRVADYIQQNESSGQPIVTFEAFDALALPYYYRGPNPILPDDNYFDFGLQAPAGTEASLARQNAFVISEIPPDSPEVWLVVNELCTATDACRPLENYVQSNYTVELEKDFYLSKVYLLKKKTQ